MIEDSLLHTKTARDIVRKSGVRSGAQDSGVSQAMPAVLAGQYSFVQQSGGLSSQYGAVVSYASAAARAFPGGGGVGGVGKLSYTGDFRNIAQARILVTVTQVAGAGCTVNIGLHQRLSNLSIVAATFTGGAPSVSIDTLGLHISDWKDIEWTEDPGPVRLAESYWFLNNPTGVAGTVGIGLCQLQIRGDQ